MSEYYKSIKKQILEIFSYFGMIEKTERCVWGFMLVLSVIALKDILETADSQRREAEVWIPLLLLLMLIMVIKSIRAGRRYKA